MYSFTARKSMLFLLVLLFFGVVAAKYMSGVHQLLYALPFFGLALFVVLYNFLAKERYFQIIVACFFVFLMFSIVTSQKSEFRSVFYLLIGFSSFLIAYVFYKMPIFAVRVIGFFLYIFNFYVLWFAFSSDSKIEIAINDIFPDSSRNIVGAISLFLLISFAASNYRVFNRLPFFAMVLTAVVVFFAYGRASMLSMAFLIFGFSLYYLKVWYFRLALLIVFPCLFYFVFDMNYIYLFFIENTNFNRGADSPRMEMIEEYFSLIDLKGLLFGVPLSEVSSVVDYGGNPHNSYMRAHSFYGFVFVFYFVSLCFYVLSKLCIKNLFYIFLLVVFMFRVVFEPLAFFDVFDFVYFYLLMLIGHTYSIDRKRSIVQSHQRYFVAADVHSHPENPDNGVS